ncbi:TPA: TraY domain-containing protein [Legionella anisa]|nr:TraY domain-containing protein [Legionella pneumophila]
MESNNNYKKVYITLQLSEASNQLLSVTAKRSNRKKIQEATLRLEDHLKKYRSISELDHAIPLSEEYV